MKRNQLWASSPTPTTFSGISNYRTESYRPLNDQGSMPGMPSSDPKVIARTHYNELQQYLVAYLAKSPANSRSAARQKLTRLTKQQFQELSTDRNQARQKLATLPTARLEDLSSDVYFELSRRYPEFKEENEVGAALVGSPDLAYDDIPSPEFHASPWSDAPAFPPGSPIVCVSEDRAIDSGYGPHTLGRRPSEDDTRKRRLRQQKPCLTQ
ncbi:hypothetical protein OG21DRAFT_1543551 [Imleria badia]|nr:hypothetical protein OG21DRAFT_1543551 [Imleria badia]